MQLRSSNPYWLFKTPLISTYKKLQNNIKVPVVVVGGGISGALAAYELVKAGVQVAIISKDHIGTASTCASTSLLQYEIDTPICRLIELVGRPHAETAYKLCYNSIDRLKQIHTAVACRHIFKQRKSLLLASHKKDVAQLVNEYKIRKALGFNVQWLSNKQVASKMGFDVPAAIYSKHAGQTDAYAFTQALVKWCAANGADVYDTTEITDIKSAGKTVIIKTSDSFTITANHVVMATGYEAVKWIKQNVARLHSTFVITSKPFKRQQLWTDECLIWETARPYTYMRTTIDHRVIIGGKDEPFSSSHKRDLLITRKTGQLLRAFDAKFPHLKFDVDFAWAGTFAETKDGLPFIGALKSLPRVYFSLGYGGNGITFSQIAAEIIRDTIKAQKNPYVGIFGFSRIA